MEEWPSGCVTFVFTDIVGSTPLVHALGDRYLTLLEQHHALMRAAWAKHHGTEVKTEGDSFFVAFQEPAAAVRACIDAQSALAEHRGSGGAALHVRMGIHRGEATLAERDYHGVAVIVAARIAAAAHGDQIIASKETVEQALADAPIAIDVRDLGFHGLKGIPEPVALQQISAPGTPAIFPTPATLRATRHNLPTPPGPLLGRADLVRQLHARVLGDARLLTLTGTGGVGKTRLALELAHELVAYIHGGVFLLEAAGLDDAAALLPRLAAILEPDATDDRSSLERITSALSEPTLLIIDNLEHLPEAGTAIADLLAAVPELRIIATSRTRLRVRAEQVFTVEPLPVPEADVVTMADVLAIPAGALFMARARATDLRREWTDTEAPAVSGIVRRLEGLPLALELAAARLAELSLDEVAAGVGRAHELLTEGDLDLPGRHRSIVATIRWSFELLADGAREVLGAASVFRGGAPRDALEAVAGRSIEEDLRELIAASLISRDPDGRVRLLEPVRAAAEALAPDADAVRASHAAWYLDLSVRSWHGVAGHQEVEWITRVTPELDNLDVALRTLSPDDALTAAAHLGRFWTRTGRARAGGALLRPLLHAAAPSHPHFGLALLALGNMERLLGAFDAATEHLVTASTIAEELADAPLFALAQLLLSDVHRAQGQTADAATLSRRALEIARQHGDRHIEGQAAQNIALSIASTDPDEALALLDAARGSFHAVGDTHNELLTTINLVNILCDRGRHEEASSLIEPLLSHLPDNPHLAGRILSAGAIVASRRGALEVVVERFRSALPYLDQIGAVLFQINAYAGLCVALHQLGRSREALDIAKMGIRVRLERRLLAAEPALPYSAAFIALGLGVPGEALEVLLECEDDRTTGPFAAELSTCFAIAQAAIGAVEEAAASLADATSKAGATGLPPELRSLAETVFPGDVLATWPSDGVD